MIKYLLDTHVVLWIAENSPMLSESAKAAVLDKSAEKYVSIASAWEIAVKLGTNKLSILGGLPEFFKILDENGFKILPVEREYLLQLGQLPDHHKDPFDRLLVATSIVENITLITADEQIKKYGLLCLW